MKFEKTYIPFRGYWSTPFAKWQGSLSSISSVHLAAQAARTGLAQRSISPEVFDSIALGITVPQKSSFYGAPWVAAMVGAEGISGPMVAQACATGARVLATAGTEVELGGEQTVLTVTTDRCSNGPHLYYPAPNGPGGTGRGEDWVMDNFGHDPWARNAMIETAENVAKEAGISREEQDALTLRRHEQYQDALANDQAFQKRYMLTPFELMDERGKKAVAKIAADEGVFPTTAEGLAKLRPVMPEGTVTFGSQTHPADGCCGMVVCDRARAKSLAAAGGPEVQLLSYGQSRVEKGRMAKATVPAARAALESASGIGIDAIDVIKTHNPFAVNDVYFAREMGVDANGFNNYGSSLIYGHPQGPTGTRLIIEMIEELEMRGGGTGLFVGCAAGDTAAAVVIRVG
ncbi:MAG: thiolase family protein [Planctomycetes bacterium]|nr:thiolase family protein [Planctomycetota bacterium]